MNKEMLEYILSMFCFACHEKSDCPKDKKCAQAKQIIIDSIEKQITKKPIEYRQWSNSCPNCKIQLKNNYPQYCDCCGQKIDWSK